MWQGLKDIATGTFGALWAFAIGTLTNLLLAFGGWKNSIVIVFESVRARISSIFSGLANWFTTVVINPIRNAFTTLATWIQTKFSSAFAGVSEIVRGSFNGMIDLINSLLQRIANAINGMAGIVNQFSWMLGFSVPTVAAPRIPRLATGAVIPPNSEFLAVMGDQRSGKNIEAPEALIRQILREEMGKIQTEIKIEFTGSLAALARELAPKIKQENTRIGGSLVKGGMTR
jgi:hypothetical protein